MEPEVIEISADQMPKPKAKGKPHNKVAFHEIIDVDMDEDDRNDAGFTEPSLELLLGPGNSSHGRTELSLGSGSSSQSDSKETNSTDMVKSNNKGKEVRVDAGYSFKTFDTVVDYSDHHYAKQKSAMNQPPKNWAKRIQEEWRILEKDLPDTIFVRVYESRMDILRAAIIGAEGTPYHDGLFFFDVCFPSTYPDDPPLVNYHSGGLSINPNLYDNGYVCLSLLNTWDGDKNEMWLPGTSTMLQVLVSIQGLILNAKPYFNEPGTEEDYEDECEAEYGDENGGYYNESLSYNEDTLILSLKTMVYTMNKPPVNFEDLVFEHFRFRVHDILTACKAYTEGVQVGCLVRGGAQDVDESHKGCSTKFKNDVASYINTLITAFKKIGAPEADKFMHLSEKISS
uniref:putative ubiquitin-conjugating enzyme E2 38 n=1 Tax=Erigeron canadensis TaxID=72917 RepID=UPI001CB8E11C|nr:putative ubiquitin-conjugating enzyme E2 38 [Erigeron canadensis]XP_043610236.1 putative ubiquitin-conjugating enzyme E2 38 [Erigeron canadensis]